MLALLRERLPDDLSVLVLPVQPVGKSNEHILSPGTLTLRPIRCCACWSRSARACTARACASSCSANSHGGNASVIATAARELRVRFGMLAVADPLALVRPAGRDVRRGRGEARHPRRRHRDVADARFPAGPRAAWTRRRTSCRRRSRWRRNSSTSPPTGTHSFGWIAQDLNPDGAVGNASIATAEKGTPHRRPSGRRIHRSATRHARFSTCRGCTRRQASGG